MKLSTALKNLKSDKDIDNFLKDLCTPAEIEAMKERWEVAQLLYKGDSTYRDIASKLNIRTSRTKRERHANLQICNLILLLQLDAQ